MQAVSVTQTVFGSLRSGIGQLFCEGPEFCELIYGQGHRMCPRVGATAAIIGDETPAYSWRLHKVVSSRGH